MVKALERLGYDVKPIKEVEYATAHIAIGNGDGTFWRITGTRCMWFLYQGGRCRQDLPGRRLLAGCATGLPDRQENRRPVPDHPYRSAQDPKLAKLFDTNGDGKADLAGCNPGWGCEKVIEHQLDAFKLRDAVTHNQGSYSAIIADTITRFKKGEPVLYYTWTLTGFLA